MLETELILKSTPPRLPRSALERARFARLWQDVRERAAVGVIAPAGFGKTTLLLQWRRLWLQHGGVVAWLTVDAQDEPGRFALGLLHSLRHATGRGGFEQLARRCAAQPDRELEAMTALLAEVAQLGLETVLMFDDAERLPDASTRLLAYLLHNAPANLHLLVGSRRPLEIETAELSAKGRLAVLRSADLRLHAEESFEILQRRFGGRIALDEAAHLHEATEGWPIGLQLACAAIERAPELSAAVRSMSGRHADLADYFMQSLYSRLPPALAEFLVQVCILERLNAELCEALTACGCAADYLSRLMLDTPFLTAAEGEEWMRLHPLARDFLLARFEALPLESREVFHCRAYHWFARRDRFHEAASHALAAGDLSATQAHAARSLWTLGTQGRLAEARAWLEQIPAQTLEEDVELRLIAAWIMVFGERNGEALQIAQAVLADPAATPATRLIASRVASGAASYADRLGLLPGIFRAWPSLEALGADPVYTVSGRNTVSVLALHRGDTAGVRATSGSPPPEGSADTLPLALAFARALVALSWLWDGDLARVDDTLRAALAEADREGGRRGMVPSLYAPILASALQQRGEHEAALATLADRLDVIERVSLPDAILLSYLTLARASLGLGDERRALQVLEDLEDFSVRRGLPRLAAYSLAERVGMHALRKRLETAEALLDRLDSLASRFDEPDFAPFEPQFQLLLAGARTRVALARGQEEAAATQLAEAEGLAARLGRGRDQMALKLLRVELLRERDPSGARALLEEVLGLAALRGDRTVLGEAPPAVARMAAELTGPQVALAPAVAAFEPVPVVVGGLLTPKEAHVLALLSQGMSNKLIARAMEISDETVKWHLKNLFAKLSAGTRKHAVGRARLLGLIAG
jgi:LuxR family maltose regulon positive regulatory protein